MKNTELRIGLWVYLFGDAVQLTADHLVYLYARNSTPEPITLTEDWLLKFGFIDPAGNTMSYRISVNTSDELCWYKQSNELRYQTKGSGFTRDFNIKYIHQLQNIYFALTGEDLKID